MKILKNNFKVPNVPYLSLPDKPLYAPSWKFIPIADIVDDLILYKDGGVALVTETSSLNFSLLSEKEQQAVITSYAGLLNSLSFPIQILVKSQKKDISNYIQFLDQQIGSIKDPTLSLLARNYKDFILSSIKKRNVLGKKFYVVIPFSPLELGVSKSLASSVRTTGHLPYPKSYVIKKAKIILYPKRDHLARQAGRFGVKVRQLNNDELINLIYGIYNPEIPVVKKIGQTETQQ